MKRFHEAPLSIFNDVQRVTDGDYALVHLLETNDAYLKAFREAKRAGREIILDNSIFELGKAFNGETYAKWIRTLEPTWYIIPDCLDDCKVTINQFNVFKKQFPDLPGKSIGVLQGKTDGQLLKCYDAMVGRVDKIAVSFDCAHWAKEFAGAPSKWHAFMLGRQHFLERLRGYKHFNKNVPLHLLGCALPQEFKYYDRENFPFIESVDTSNPVVHGLKGIWYDKDGLKTKESQKLCDLIDANPGAAEWMAIMFNISEFKRYCNG